jgi:hypothetical protein
MAIKKIKLSLCLIKQYAMKAHRGMEVYFYGFFASTLDGKEWSVYSQLFYRGKIIPPVLTELQNGSAPETVWTRR